MVEKLGSQTLDKEEVINSKCRFMSKHIELKWEERD